ncbi:MAG: dioxygenase [Patescibacteria group bacterium]|nr:dioxygenase [Patescibacteria group bacterium]
MISMPTLFISHGSPMLALEEKPTTRFLRSLSARLPKPKAIVAASAHWETPEPLITGANYPETIHDFGGFPKELYQLRYPAPGDPALAERVQALLMKAGFKADIDPVRGLDHGAWNPLLLMYPAADIPVIELSVQPKRDAAWHYRIGQALAPLREENILIIGTGNLTHNLREAFRGDHEQIPLWVSEFAEWVSDKAQHNDIQNLLAWQERAPYARQNHPTPEHFLPFFVALGAAGDAARAERLNAEVAMAVLAMDVYLFAEN